MEEVRTVVGWVTDGHSVSHPDSSTSPPPVPVALQARPPKQTDPPRTPEKKHKLFNTYLISSCSVNQTFPSNSSPAKGRGPQYCSSDVLEKVSEFCRPRGLCLSLALAQEGAEDVERGWMMGLWLRKSYPDV